jgi:hypothetical protein
LSGASAIGSCSTFCRLVPPAGLLPAAPAAGFSVASKPVGPLSCAGTVGVTLPLSLVKNEP